MSTTVTNAFVQQFSANITLLAQQKGTRLRAAVREESVVGEKAFFDNVSSAAAVKRTTRHADSPLVELPHDRRMAVMSTYEWGELIDTADRVAMLADPQSVYSQAAAAAMGRSIDDEIIAAATGTALTGKSGSTSTSMLAAHEIAHGSADLTIAKLLQAKEVMDEADEDPQIPRHIVVSPDQITALLNTTEVKSSDFNTVNLLPI